MRVLQSPNHIPRHACASFDDVMVWWRSWLYCATCRKVAVSIPDDVIGIFHRRHLSGRTMALGSTHTPNRKEYQVYFLGVKSGRWVGLKTLPPSCADSHKIWEPQLPGTLEGFKGIYLYVYHAAVVLF